MGKRKKPRKKPGQTKKSTKPQIDWHSIIISGLIDLLVGTLLLVIEKMIK